MVGPYSTVVQRDYRPQMRAGIPGMVSHETSYDISTWLCGTAAGIPFGAVVTAVAGQPKQAVIGGSGPILGIAAIDITQTGLPLDPLGGVETAADKYPLGMNMGVLTRGRIWVLAQADVNAGDAVYYEQAGGTLSNSASGTAASGQVQFTSQPNDGDTITLNGTVITFKTTGATGSQVNIGATLGGTLSALESFINTNAAADAQVAKFKAEAYPPSPGGAGEGSGANTLRYGARTVGTAGNALTVTSTVTGTTVTGMAGGTAAATLIPSAMWLDTAVAGDIARISLALQR